MSWIFTWTATRFQDVHSLTWIIRWHSLVWCTHVDLLNHVYIHMCIYTYLHICIHIDIHIACIYLFICIYAYISLFKPMKYIHYSAANQLFFADCPQPLVCWHFRLVCNSQGHTYHNLIICHYAPYNSKTVNLNLCEAPNNLRTNHSPIQSISIGTNHYLEKQHIPRCRFLK